ncbi:MAG: YdhR family protein [Caldilineaceae bacterium]|nr:YdhR family protein [Caldilineaceae bacterium]
MTQQILQINFKFHLAGDAYREAVAPVAEPIAAVPGLYDPVGGLDEADQEAGGIYLFEDDASLAAYLDGEIVAAIVGTPIFSDFDVKQFAVMSDVSEITRAPLSKTVAG